MAPARRPVRRAGNGQLPVRGWGGYFDLIGFVPFEELPSISNPRDVRIINANNKTVPDNFAHLIAVDWPPPYRAARTATVLGDTAGSHGVTDPLILQQHIVASSADRVLPTQLANMPAQAGARAAVARSEVHMS